MGALAALEHQKNSDILLELQDIHMYFGRVGALVGIDLQVRKGEIHSIIGPNGAGKTVMMNCINGLYRPQQGDIFFKGQNINKLNPHARASWALPEPFKRWRSLAA